MNTFKIIIKEHWLFLLLFSCAAVLRFIPLFDYQFTYDELANLDWAQAGSFSELIQTRVKNDVHPVFVAGLVYFLNKAFGYSEWLIKLPFLLFSLGAMIYAYRFSLHNFSKRSALFAVLFFGFSLIFIFYASIARMYMAGVFFSLGLLYHGFEILFLNSRRFKDYLFLGLFILFCALNQHINALFAFTAYTGGLFFLKKENMKPYLITGVCAVLAYAPHLPITLFQLGMGGIGADQGGWLDKPYPDAWFAFIKILLGTGKTYLLVLVIIITSGILDKNIRLQKKQWFLLLIFVIDYLIVYLYSVYKAPIFQNSVMLFPATALVLFLCSLIDLKNHLVFASAFTLLFAALVYKSYFKKDYYQQAVKTVFDEQFKRTVAYKDKFGKTAVYPIFFDADDIMKKIYLAKYGMNFDYSSPADSIPYSTERFSFFISDLKADHLALSSSTPLFHALTREYFPYLTENTQTQGIHYKVYSKIQPATPALEDVVISASDVYNWRSFNYPKLKEKPKAGEFSLPVIAVNEFPFDAIAKYSDVIAMEGEMVLASAKVRGAVRNLELCMAVNDPKTNASLNYTAKPARDFIMSEDSITTVYCQMYVGRNHRAIKDKATLACYLWNKGREKFELLDFKVEVIDHWHQKWNYWE